MSRWLTYAVLLAATAALGASAYAIVRVGAAAESAIAETRETMHQARLALGSVRGLTFDLRKNWTANTELQSRATKQAAESLERIVRATEMTLARFSDSMAGVGRAAEETLSEAKLRLIPAAEGVLREVQSAAAGVRPVLDETRATVAAARPVLDSTRAAVDGVAAETRATIAEVRPVLQSTDQVVCAVGQIADSGARVAEHYERLITRPTWKQRAKGYIQLILSAFNLWGNARLAF